MKMKCGGKTRNGGKCKQRAGWGTGHVGDGRCKLHGGASPRGVDSPHYIHGRYTPYASVNLGEKIDRLEGHELLDLADELQMQRALIGEYLERYPDKVQMTEHTIGTIISWLNQIGVTVQRIIQMKNETALTSVEVAYLKTRIVDLLGKYIPDPNQQEAFVIELFAIDQQKQLK